MGNPMNSPEVQIAVSRHLGRSDLAACARVSKTWFDIFMPLVFSSEPFRVLDTLKESRQGVTLLTPSPAYLNRYGKRIQELIISVPSVLRFCYLYLGIPDVPAWEPTQPSSLSELSSLPQPSSPIFSGVKALSLNVTSIWKAADLFEWLSHCPLLEKLRLPMIETNTSDLPPPDWSRLQMCSRLNTLSFDGVLEEWDLAGILAHCPHVTNLGLNKQRITRVVFKAMEPLLQNLTVLTIFECWIYDGWIYRYIFESSPKLVSFMCSELTVDLLFEDKDRIVAPAATTTNNHGWACSDLEVLQIGIMRWSGELWKNEWVMGQLELLQKLNVLVLVTMECGSEVWARGQYERQDLEEDPDMEWMLTAWPNLKFYGCKTNRPWDPSVAPTSWYLQDLL